MTHSKKRLSTALLLVLVLCISLVALTACNGADAVVKFMVEKDGEWKVETTKTAVDGAVELPQAPAKSYYTFANWYTEKEFANVFDEKNVSVDTTVYAKYNPVEVTVHINNNKPVTKNLIDVVNGTFNPGEGLDFDGWYKDANYSVRWNGEDVVQDLYAKSVATIKFTNGWAADDFTTTVNPGEVLDLQKEVVLEDQSKTTFEKANIVKSYMSDKDIKYVDEKGNIIDFTKPVTKSMNVTIKWNSKMVNTFLQPIPQSKAGHYMVEVLNLFDPEWGTGNFDVANAPIISFNNEFTMVKDGVEEQVIVDYVYFNASSLPDSAKKIIIGEGIQAIQGFNAVGASAVEEIVLPKSLKILDNSFNNMPNLKGVTLPEGLEVLIGSFSLDSASTHDVHSVGKANPNFEIIVPDSVKNIAMMPANLVFSKTEATAENGDFYKGEDGRIYLNKDNKKVLISDPFAFTDSYDAVYQRVPKAGTIVVPSDVDGIQVGTYCGAFDYLVLPKSFSFVNYNALLSDYAEIYDRFTGHRSAGNVLFDADAFKTMDITAPFDPATMESEAYAITNGVGSYAVQGVITCGSGIVITNQEASVFANNKELKSSFIKASGTDWMAIGQPDVDNSIVYNDTKNSVFATIQYKDPKFSNLNHNVNVRLENVNNIVTDDIVAALIAKDKQVAESIKITTDLASYLSDAEITLFDQNGNKVEEGTAVTSDMFLTLNVKIIPKLTINSNWKITHKPGPPPWDYSNPANGGLAEEGTCKVIMDDITGLSVESIKKAILDAAIIEAKNMLSQKPQPPFAVPSDQDIKANLEYFYNNATVEFKVNGEVVDPTTITLDNGSVTLEVKFA